MLAAAAGLAVGVPPAVAAERSGENGRIAFASDRDGDEDIWLMRPDGSDLVNLTADSEASDFGPSWRTDGRKIAFREDRRSIPPAAGPCRPDSSSPYARDDAGEPR